MQRHLTTCLWMEDTAEEAAEFYASLLPDTKIHSTSPYRDAHGDLTTKPAGSVMSVSMEILGQPFMLLNGGPHFTLSEATSFILHCDTQEEIDRYWDGLVAGGGQHSQCGWLTDRFGVTWQVVPTRLHELLDSDDPAVCERVTQAFLGMTRFDLAELERAAAEPTPA